MNWSNRSKKFLVLFSVGGLLVVIAGIVAVKALVGPLVGCTLVGCVGSLEVRVAGLPSDRYEISVRFSSGDTKMLSCGPGAVGEVSTTLGEGCSANGAFFRLEVDKEPSSDVTVTINVDGKTYSRVFKPDYNKFRPNGKYCPPTCYSSLIEMAIMP